MKYINDIFKISIFVTLLYIPLLWYSISDVFKADFENQNRTTYNKLVKVRNDMTQLVEQGRILEACQKLKAEQEALSIATYYLKSSDAECFYPTERAVIPPIEANGRLQTFNVNGSMLSFFKENTHGIEWNISGYTPQDLTIIERLTLDKTLRSVLVSDLLHVIYILFLFIFLAVLILAKSIQNQYRKQGKDPLWLRAINATFGKMQLHDLKIIKSATSVLVTQNENLAKDKDLLETSLEYSILNEIRKNNHNVPYTFFGTVAKVDINGFSKVVNAGESNQSHNLTLLLEEHGCELLQRYGGLFEKTVGDEIVVVFKSDNSALFATAFARDLMNEFSILQFNIANEKRSFTLKAAISSSNLTFSKRAPGYGFHGDALTYASRLLDMVTEKDRNFLSCTTSEASDVDVIVKLPTQPKKFEFKNMTPTEGFLIDQFVSVEEVYSKAPDLLTFYRSDNSLVYMLNRLTTETDKARMGQVIQVLKSVKVRKCSAELISAWAQSIREIEAKAKLDSEYFVLLAKLIMKGSNLIPQTQWTSECTDTLLKISRDLDGRINASIVEVLIEKNLHIVVIGNESSFIIDNEKSFRTRGNLLINQAYHKLDEGVFNKVIKMINSDIKLESDTGLFCACSIIIHYQQKNPAELETYSSYNKLVKMLSKMSYENDELSSRLSNLLTQTLDMVSQNSKVA